ncbi:alpha-glucosidase [Caldilinea sp.]|uniref:alpha-glucosidase n=1 Tax=Caldilinea sp. TaxID=2293560 RepID=UPI002BD8F233|nr:alpha-glucosidase [Caldilinea sp.]
MIDERAWWKEAVVYQIYPKSFYDSNGDGVGDLPGIIAKLDALAALGVNVLWLTPIYASPEVDNGYDISDYQAVNPKFGTMADFEQLLNAAHCRGMRVIMDLVVNHTSDQHAWFIESRKSRDNPYRDYYIWRDGKNGREPNNWGGHFTRSAWSFDATTGQYYLHIFSPQQPDLNWENPAVRAEVGAIIAWWLAKGIDGFRLDAINLISKAPGLPDNAGAGRYVFAIEHFCKEPRFHTYLHELHQAAFAHHDVLTVGECADLKVADAIAISDPARGELNMAFLFEHTDYYHTVGKDAQQLKEILTRWQTGLHGRGWAGIAFNNHDQPRVVSCFGDDTHYRAESAKLFATLLLTLEGTPFLLQGEEIGMTDARYATIEEYNDVGTVNIYREQVANGADPQLVFEKVRATSRDRGRSPYQWSAIESAGFTTGAPWIGVNPNYLTINLEAELSDPASVFHYYRQMIALRKRIPALIYGEFIAQEAPTTLYVYQRLYQDQRYQIVLNLSEERVAYPCVGDLLIGNYAATDQNRLQPYEARVYRLV